MIIRKWVDMGAEVEIQIDAEDVVTALKEACIESDTVWALDNRDRDTPVVIGRALNFIAVFFRGISDEDILRFSPEARALVAKWLIEQNVRWAK
jgi:hypothetical protein